MNKPEKKNAFSVSVVIPAYNAGEFIGRAIESVLGQSYGADEIIVVDDGSTDNTASEIKKFGDKVHYIYQENIGPNTSRNTGIRAAKYDWIAFLDADDEWLPEHLKRQKELLERNPHLRWSTSNYLRCLCKEKRQSPHQLPAELNRLLDGNEYFVDYLEAFVTGAAGHTDTMVIERNALLESGMFLEGLERFQDMDLWFRLAFRWPEIGYISQPSAIHHVERSGSISKRFTQMQLYRDLIDRQLKAAENFNRRAAFEPVARYLLRGWMRSMLFDARGNDIRELANHFRWLLPGWYLLWISTLASFPQVSAAGCRLIATVIRRLHR